MRKYLLAGAMLALVPFAASAQITLQDVAFVAGVEHVDWASISQGGTATSKAANPDVKNFAAQLVAYHTAQNAALTSMAPPVPTTATPCMTWQSVLVNQTNAPGFDPAFLQATIYNDQRLIDVLQGEISAGSDANLKAYAQRELPNVQAELAMAQRLLAGGPVNPPQSPLIVHPTFRSGEWSLSPADQSGLSNFAHQLTGMQGVQITATGYTDTVPIGPELKRAGVPTNEVLSEKRAGSVAQYLVSQGVPQNEITTRGMGPANPVASNATEAGRAQNRRVEVALGGSVPMAGGLGVSGAVAGIPACRD